MNARLIAAAMAGLLCAANALAKIPPPPPPDPAAAAEKKAKDDAAAEKAKADQAAAEDYAIKNYQANMKKQGKPIPKPVPVTVASTPTSAKAAPQGNTVKSVASTAAGDKKADTATQAAKADAAARK